MLKNVLADVMEMISLVVFAGMIALWAAIAMPTMA